MNRYRNSSERKTQHRQKGHMSKSKNHKNGEDLRQEVKKWKSYARHLEKQLKRYQKLDHYLEEALETVEEVQVKEIEKEHKPIQCPECRKGTLSQIDLGRVIYNVCSNCSYRKKTQGQT